MSNPLSASTRIFGTNATYHHPDRLAKSSGKEAWQVKLGDFAAVGTLLASDKGLVFLQTPEQLIAVNTANGSVRWKQESQAIGNAILTPNDGLLHVQGKDLVLRSAETGDILKKLPVQANANFVPRLTTNQLILVQETVGDKTLLSAYDLALNKAWDIPFSQTHAQLQVYPLKDSLILLSQEGVSCYSLDGKKVWSLSVAQIGGQLPNLIAKLSEDSLLLHNYSTKVPSLILTISTAQVKPIQLPDAIVGFPVVVHKPDGEFALFYQAQAKDLGFGNKEYRLVMVDQQGNKRWEVTNSVQPRFMIADQSGNLFVAFSPTLEQFNLYGSYRESSPCFVKGFDTKGSELFTYTASNPRPILSPLSIGVEGELYFVADGTLHAIH